MVECSRGVGTHLGAAYRFGYYMYVKLSVAKSLR